MHWRGYLEEAPFLIRIYVVVVVVVVVMMVDAKHADV